MNVSDFGVDHSTRLPGAFESSSVFPLGLNLMYGMILLPKCLNK